MQILSIATKIFTEEWNILSQILMHDSIPNLAWIVLDFILANHGEPKQLWVGNVQRPGLC